MRIYTREDGDHGWAPVAMIMTALVIVMAMGYFLWYAPAHTVAVAPRRDVIVNTPAAVAPPATTTVVLPGPSGPAGAAGSNGADGADGAPGTSHRHHRDRSDADDSTDGGGKSSGSTDGGDGSNSSKTDGSAGGEK